jgi:methyltransferase (TIGR00027 family)
MSHEPIARTSLLIAAATLMARDDQDLDGLAARIAACALARADAPGRRLLWLVRRGAGRALLRLAERLMLPGIARHYVWRKRRIAAWVDALQCEGVSQLIVLGAGFDALACRFAQGDASHVAVEVDRAPASALKRTVLAELGTQPSNLHCLAVDLALEPIGAALSRCAAFDPTRPTVVVAEGVLMYLEPCRVARLMHSLRAVLLAPATLLGSVMTRHADGRVGFAQGSSRVAAWLRHRGEPFRWGVEAAHLGATLPELDLQLDAVADPLTPGDADPCPGEWLFRARLAPRARRDVLAGATRPRTALAPVRSS